MNLFPDSIPTTTTQKELEKVIAQFPQYSRVFVATAAILKRRNWVEAMWKDYEPYAENNFRTEIEKGVFNEKAWELYIFSYLKSKGIAPLRKTGEGPDFHINLSGQDIFIEATAPSIGEVDPSPERPDLKPGEIYTGGGDIEENYRTLVLRFTAAVRNKSNKVSTSQYYKGRNAGTIKESDCYIVAINGYDFTGLVHDPAFLLRRSLFAAGCTALPRLADGTFGKGQYLYQPIVKKYKTLGTIEEVPTDIFTNDSYKEISAIIYSPEHIINTGTDLNKIGDTLFLVKNLFASNPLPNTFPRCGSEIIYDKGAITTNLFNPEH